jgi:hypothetical protein
MYANVITFQGQPDRMQDIGDYFREHVLPTLQAQAGFQGVTTLVNRENGKLMGISLWESEQTANAAVSAIRQLAAAGATRMGAAQPTRELYEVVAKI